MLTGQCPSEDQGAGASDFWDFHIPGVESPSFFQGEYGIKPSPEAGRQGGLSLNYWLQQVSI